MKKVLLIEDDKFLVKVYSKLLEKKGYQTKYLENGLKAVSTAQKFKPDFIILDLIMPQKDGFETLEDLKSNKATKNIPVLVLSVLGEKEDVNRALQFGAAKYIHKKKLTFNGVIQKIENFKG